MTAKKKKILKYASFGLMGVGALLLVKWMFDKKASSTAGLGRLGRLRLSQEFWDQGPIMDGVEPPISYYSEV